MAAVAKSGTPSLATTLPGPEHSISGLTNGSVALAAFDACYIDSAGLVQLSTGAAATAPAKVRGYAAQAYAIGATDVTLYFNVRVRYGAGLTPGTDLFLSAATPGALSDVATTGGTAPIGYVVDATRVQLNSSRY
jgi:hypothetical protein